MKLSLVTLLSVLIIFSFTSKPVSGEGLYYETVAITTPAPGGSGSGDPPPPLPPPPPPPSGGPGQECIDNLNGGGIRNCYALCCAPLGGNDVLDCQDSCDRSHHNCVPQTCPWYNPFCCSLF